MPLIRTLAAWRPDLSVYREVEEAFRISLKSLARRDLELQDESTDLDAMIEAIVKDLAPELLRRPAFNLKPHMTPMSRKHGVWLGIGGSDSRRGAF